MGKFQVPRLLSLPEGIVDYSISQCIPIDIPSWSKIAMIFPSFSHYIRIKIPFNPTE